MAHCMLGGNLWSLLYGDVSVVGTKLYRQIVGIPMVDCNCICVIVYSPVAGLDTNKNDKIVN